MRLLVSGARSGLTMGLFLWFGSVWFGLAQFCSALLVWSSFIQALRNKIATLSVLTIVFWYN